MKVKKKEKRKKRIRLYSWLPTRTFHKNLAICKKAFPSKFGEFGPIFSMQNPFDKSK
jgi:hypothetical protein